MSEALLKPYSLSVLKLLLKRIALSSDSQVLVRPFQEEDSDSVREAYLKAMLTGSGSPAQQAQKAQLTRSWSLYFYLQMLVGAFLALRAGDVGVRLGGGFLLVSSLGFLYAWCRNTQKAFQLFTTSAVTGDLAYIDKNYSAPGSGFWVAEVTSGTAAGRIVGCVGLDSSARTEAHTAELRRMAVLPEFQGHGIGKRLLSALVSHAREQGLTTITLSTSMYQVAAMKMYEAAGFREVGQTMHTVKFLFILSSATLSFFSMSL